MKINIFNYGKGTATIPLNSNINPQSSVGVTCEACKPTHLRRTGKADVRADLGGWPSGRRRSPAKRVVVKAAHWFKSSTARHMCQ